MSEHINRLMKISIAVIFALFVFYSYILTSGLFTRQVTVENRLPEPVSITIYQHDRNAEHSELLPIVRSAFHPYWHDYNVQSLELVANSSEAFLYNSDHVEHIVIEVKHNQSIEHITFQPYQANVVIINSSIKTVAKESE